MNYPFINRLKRKVKPGNNFIIMFRFTSVIVIIFFLFSSYISPTLGKNEVLLQVMMQGLNSAHFRPLELNDSFSNNVYSLFLERLDYNKRFLIQSDIDQLKKYQFEIDDEVRNGSLQFFQVSSKIIDERIKADGVYYKEILARPFDFGPTDQASGLDPKTIKIAHNDNGQDETIELDPKKIKFAKDESELKDSWRKSLKYQTMISLAIAVQNQEKAKEKKDTSIVIKSFSTLEEEARKKVLKSQDDYFKFMSKIDSNDRLSLYLNSITNVYDPHTTYFPPKDKENFDISMTGRLEGIGATLQEKDGNIKVMDIVPGSASWHQGELKSGDIILKVAQGIEDPVDIVGMRLDNAVHLIRGPKGTEVRLTVKRIDGTLKVIPITRDIVVIEETYAQSALIKDKAKNIGYIKLPVFYADFNRNGGRNSSDDVKKELIKLKQENVEGIIIDLRNNGGGSLQDVIDMMGLFIEKGPVVQVKSKQGEPSILADNDPAIYHDGPLLIMVNSNSASASEILAAAIQDYKRGVIVGTTSTFGKGTVQRITNLDDYLLHDYSFMKPLGSIKITTQKFYRINGHATQLKGVTPDIVVPDAMNYIESGEKEQEYPMAWDEISAVKYDLWKKPNDIYKLEKNSALRIKNNLSFNSITLEAEKLKKKKDETVVNLNFTKYMQELKEAQAEEKKNEKIQKETVNLEVASIPSDIALMGTDSVKIARNKDWHKNLKKDIYVSEAVSIIKEMK